MPIANRIFPFAFILLTGLGGCGFYVPEKYPFNSDQLSQGNFENVIVNNIKCELHKGVQDTLSYYEKANDPGELARIQWLRQWGALIQLKITADEMSGLAPGVSFFKLFPNSENISFGLAASGGAHATRVETISFAVSFKELLSERSIKSCAEDENGILIQSDLKIGQFIFDKSVLATTGGSVAQFKTRGPPYTVLSDEITFVTSFGGSVTPTWKFATVSADSSGTLLSATRTKTDDVIITLGYVTQEATAVSPVVLSMDAQTIHNALVTGSAVGTSNQSNTR
jgi:hypothetical protein